MIIILSELLKKKILLLSDGATGTELVKHGLTSGICPELWNVERPSDVLAVVASYVEAGSDLVEANTFGGNRIKLQKYGLQDRMRELNVAGVALAKQAAKGKEVLVLADIGPTGELLEPLGTMKESEAVEVFREQAAVLAEAGVDGFAIETMMSLEEAEAALTAIKETTALPVIVSLTFNKGAQGFATMMGVTPQQAAKTLAAKGADVIGANCSAGSADMVELTRQFRANTDLPLWIKPNAGLPRYENGRTVFAETPEEFLENMKKIVAEGANIIGGCCGTTPEHIKKLSKLKQ